MFAELPGALSTEQDGDPTSSLIFSRPSPSATWSLPQLQARAHPSPQQAPLLPRPSTHTQVTVVPSLRTLCFWGHIPRPQHMANIGVSEPGEGAALSENGWPHLAVGPRSVTLLSPVKLHQVGAGRSVWINPQAMHGPGAPSDARELGPDCHAVPLGAPDPGGQVTVMDGPGPPPLFLWLGRELPSA